MFSWCRSGTALQALRNMASLLQMCDFTATKFSNHLKVSSEELFLRAYGEKFKLSKLQVSTDIRSSANWVVRETDDDPK